MTRMVLVAFLAALMAACVQTPSTREGSPQEQDARNRARVHTELGAAYYGAGQYQVAFDELRIALDADPNYIPAINQLGLVHLALGQDKEAKAQIQKAIRLDPNDPSVNNNYGLLLCTLGNEDEAMRYFNKALENPLYQTPEFAYVNAGICVKNKGDDARAEAFLRKALALSPDQPQALYQMADISYRKGDLKSARSYITRHLRVVLPGPDALLLAAKIEKRLGDTAALDSYGAQLNRRFPDADQTKAFNEGRLQ